ncbi:MAG TPA: gluconokinase [Burkholderiaceae bacterium]|nr:gluconokinase [Burkholderiaceae bacterium]
MRPIVVMGVSGSGKSTIGAALARELHAEFLEGDSFHPPDNVARMAAGIALTDADRQGWLATLGARLGAARREGRPVVMSCSALKRSYRDTLRAQAPDLALLYLAGTPPLLMQRMAGRQGHYMPPSLLASQLATLEPPQPDECALTLDIAREPAALVRDALAWLQGHPDVA